MSDRLTLLANLKSVKQKIARSYEIQRQNFASDNSLKSSLPRLVAVSKRHSADAISTLHQAGQSEFGENHLQEAMIKKAQLPNSIEWHFIGSIQSNKTQQIALNFDWVHSVDRFKIANRLSTHRCGTENKLNFLVQVNIDNEATKSGISPLEVIDFVSAVVDLPNIVCRGLMCIPNPNKSKAEQRQSFAYMYEIWSKACQKFNSIDTLSMGMSSDMDIAIESGSNLVRVGTDIFGERS